MISVVVEDKDYQEIIEISQKEDIHHLKNVFRVTVSDTIRAVDGNYEYICVVQSMTKDKIILSIKEKNKDPYSINLEISAAVSLIKNDKMEMCIQKLAELGIDEFIPCVAKRCVVKLDSKKEKWDKIVKETMKQCQGVRPMKISQVTPLMNLDFSSFDKIIVPYEGEDIRLLKNIFEKTDRRILYVIGPEGGFEKSEIEFLKNKGAVVVSLGRRILRAETAAIVTGGIIINEFQ